MSAWGDGFVAAGTGYSFDSGAAATGPPSLADLVQGVFWHSPDGLRWERSPHDPAYRGVMISNLVALDDRLLAIGVAGICWPDACSLLPPNGGAVVFESSDGVTWRRLLDTGLEAAAVVSVMRGGPGLVAAGFVADAIGKPDDDAWSAPTDAAVWTSRDGRRWTAAAMPAEPDRAGPLWLHDDGTIGLVAAERFESAYWRSIDGGQTWKEVLPIGDPICGALTAPFGKNLVNVRRAGELCEGRASDIRVANLLDARPSLATATTLLDFHELSLTVIGDELLLAGQSVARTGDLLPVVIGSALYVSRDALEWREISSPPGWGKRSILRLTVGLHALVAQLGEEDLGPPVDSHNVLWVAPDR